MQIFSLPYDWKLWERISEYESDPIEIHAWCLNKESKPSLVRVVGYPLSFYLELPNFISGKNVVWTDSRLSILKKWINDKLKLEAPLKISYVRKKKLYYYRGNNVTFPMLHMTFSNDSHMKRCKYLFNKACKIEGIGLFAGNVWEDDIPQVRKFLTYAKLQYTQWFESKHATLVADEEKLTSLEHEYKVHYTKIVPIAANETKLWRVKPKILSWDIECYSSNEKAMPDPYSPRDDCYMITCVFSKLGEPESRSRYSLVVGDCPPSNRENAQTLCYASESDMLDGFQTLIRREDPDVLIGYNIIGFDYPYVHGRISRKNKRWEDIGRIIGKKSEFITFSWESSMYGHNEICYTDMDGRISIDLLPLIKREHNRLDDFKLETVSQKFLGRGKHDVSAQEMFRIYRTMKQSKSLIEKFKLKESVYVSELDPSFLDKFSKEEMSRLEEVKERLIKKLSSYTPQDDEDIRNIYRISLCEYAKVRNYAEEDSELVIDLFDTLVVWYYLLEASSIEGVSIMSLFTRGQQIRHVSQLYNHCEPLNIVVDKRFMEYVDYQGAYVADPIPGMYENVICLDFASLYPSIMQAYNICYTTLISPEFYSSIPEDDCHIFDFDSEVPLKSKRKDGEDENANEDRDVPYDSDEEEEEDESLNILDEEGNVIGKKKTRTVHYHYRFIKQSIWKGVLPTIVENLVAARNDVREQIKTETDKLYKMILDKRQLAIKVSANSKYGALGAQNGKRPLVEGAMCVTAKGRELIHMVNEYLKNKYNANIVYNDTDSVFIDMGIKDPAIANSEGHRLSAEVSALFPKPLKMEFEKAMIVTVFGKKQYAYFLLGKDNRYATSFEKLQKKGIKTARRDICPWARKFFDQLLYHIMLNGSCEAGVGIIISNIQDVMKNNDVSQFGIIRGVAAHYKSDTYFMKIFADALRERGTIVNGGDRLRYVVLEQPAYKGGELLGHHMMLIEHYNGEPIDKRYYLEKQLMNGIDKMFGVKYGSFQEFKLGRKKISAKTPMKTILNLMESGYEPSFLYNLLLKENELYI
jgi:DNA polymerase elongation subunit (family B)